MQHYFNEMLVPVTFPNLTLYKGQTVIIVTFYADLYWWDFVEKGGCNLELPMYAVYQLQDFSCNLDTRNSLVFIPNHVATTILKTKLTKRRKSFS